MKRSVWIEKGLKSYSVRWYDETGKKQRAWCPDYPTAQRQYVETKRRLLEKAQGLGDLGAKPLEIMEKYLAFISASHRAGTLRLKRHDLTPFLKQFHKMGEISSQQIRRYREDRLKTCSTTTVSIELRDIRTFLNWCVRDGYLVESPFKDIQIPHSKELGRKLTLDELERIIQASNARFRPFLMLLVYTGCRVGEALKARHEDIVDGLWTIPKENTKTSLGRAIPLDETILKGLPSGEGIIFKDYTPRTPLWFFRLALREAKIEGRVRIHDIRHTFASHWTGQPIELMRILGWKSMAMLSRYTHLDSKTIVSSMKQFSVGADLGRKLVTHEKQR